MRLITWAKNRKNMANKILGIKMRLITWAKNRKNMANDRAQNSISNKYWE